MAMRSAYFGLDIPLAQKPPQGPGVPDAPSLAVEQPAVPAPAPATPPAPQYNTPKFNPNTNTRDLSDLSPMQQLGLRIGNLGAGLQGKPLPSTQLLEQRRAQYQQDRQEFLQGVEMLEKYQERLNKAPLKDRARIQQGFRGQFTQMMGAGSERMFDDVFGQEDISQGILDFYKDSPLIQAEIARGASYDDIRAVMRTPYGIEESMRLDDAKNFDPAVEGVRKLLGDPARARELEGLIKDGATPEVPGGMGMTIDEFVEANQRSPSGPGGYRLNQAQINALYRNEEKLAAAFPNIFRTRESTKKLQELKDTLPFELALQKAKSDGKGGTGTDPFTRAAALEELKRSDKVIGDNDTAVDTFERLYDSLGAAEKLLASGKVKTGVVSGGLLGKPIQKFIGDEADVNVVEQAFGNQWIGTIQSVKGLMGQLSNQEGTSLERVTGGFDKDDKFNLQDIRNRMREIEKISKRKLDERNRSAKSRTSLQGMAGIGEAVGPTPERESRIGAQPKQVLKREYSPSKDKTRITFSDGTTEVVDGKQQ